MSEVIPPIDPELQSLHRKASDIDDEITALRPLADASLVGSPERQKLAELTLRSQAAWAEVGKRAAKLMG